MKISYNSKKLIVASATIFLTIASFRAYAGAGADAWQRTINKFAPPQLKLFSDVGFTIYHVSTMNDDQKKIANERAKAIDKDDEAKKHRYVAVPIPKQDQSKPGPKSDLAVIDTKTGKPVNDKAYQTDKVGELKNGTSVKLGDMDAYVMNTNDEI